MEIQKVSRCKFLWSTKYFGTEILETTKYLKSEFFVSYSAYVAKKRVELVHYWLSLLVLCSVQFARDCALYPWQLGVAHHPVSFGDQLAADGPGHFSGVRGKVARRDSEGAAA